MRPVTARPLRPPFCRLPDPFSTPFADWGLYGFQWYVMRPPPLPICSISCPIWILSCPRIPPLFSAPAMDRAGSSCSSLASEGLGTTLVCAKYDVDLVIKKV